MEFVKWLHAQPGLAKIPLVILSGVASRLEPEVLRQLNATGSISKTADVDKLAKMLRPFLPW
jgi:hypothetical protein